MAALLAFGLLVGLGTWQLQRRAWKLDLIARVDARVHAAPTAPPPPAIWPGVSAERDEYRHVRVSGEFRPGPETLVQAVTALGPGYWVMAPLTTDAGYTVLINRGFIPADQPPPATPREAMAVTGLLRISEPHGAFLHANDPPAGRWYSRDIAAIAVAQGLGPVAPYFIDADATPNPGGWPVGGLTVINFPNNHMAYAFTWFGLALMVAAGGVFLIRDELSLRRGLADRPRTE
ncbi:MAG: SURF1 family protein, partial [Caulobacteraceae bacterium]|nr:SURF1 family protein [Caulobacteraceae bacterium]